ncbi:hypothetical protein E4U13_001609 [Claviceps humidiphila]|uniref:Uncharacterized protein n=1 Tax=Claviceps humidiphila TaxID=1294629 RepID=A0A9P7PZZ9_9HYPO|nr:hypothetical protein E4U13_001609 [Claviceps humidiphila]
MPNFQPSLNLKSFKTTPSGTEYQETPYRSDSPSAKCRRSVPSMKGLMPLALSSPFSNSGSSSQSVTIDDGEVVPYNGCLPELLAQDLERSSDTFASKDMTAGTPNTVPKTEERIRTRVSKASYSPYCAASARVQVLSAIEERDSMVSFMDQQEPELVVDQHSDSASTTSHDSSEEAEPPSFRHRGSVVTSATSVGSTPYSKTKVSSLAERSCACSWIDVDSDRDEDEEIFDDCHFDSLSPRPPTPAADSEARMPPVAAVPRADVPSIRSRSSCMFRPRSNSVNEDLSNPTVRRYSMGPPVRLPQRSSSINTLLPRTSMSCAESSLPQTFGTRAQRRSKKPERIQTLAIDTACNDGFVPICVREAVMKPSLMRDLSPMDDGYTESDNEAMWSPMKMRAPKENPIFVRPPSPPQQLHSVQSWLNSSLQPFPWSSHGEDNAKLVPLPPDAVENLRISVALFPETMLLTSSLTVETIRSFSKKVRRPSLESSSIVLGEGLLPESPRRSLWRKVIPHRRGSQFSDPRTLSAPPSPRHPGSSAPTSPASTDTLKPWMPLKNVFGCCSDYICDALYAHIVAYNYVSAFLSKTPVPLSASGHSGTLNLRESPSHDDIPAKAAYLLGLSASGDGAATMGRFPHRLGSLPGDRIMEGISTHRDTVLIAQDNTLRAIQSGLLRCVSRLLNTAKHMAENDTTQDGVIEVESGDADMLFLRSLCEIVRMAEDSM